VYLNKPPARTGLAFPQRIVPSTRIRNTVNSSLIIRIRSIASGKVASPQSHRLTMTRCMLCVKHLKGKVAMCQSEASIHRSLGHIVKVYIKVLHSSALER
jgi:hypothetical protein